MLGDPQTKSETLALIGSRIILYIIPCFAIGSHPEHAASRRLCGAVYLLGLVAIGIAWSQRGFSTLHFLVFGTICEFAGLFLVAALLGWAVPRIRSSWGKPIPEQQSASSPARWFLPTQAVGVGIFALLTLWVSVDFSFHDVGRDQALLGLAGRSASCPAALMLLGTTILMAWQSRGEWRMSWQYAAMAIGLLFTSSFGWASVDPHAPTPWSDRSQSLLITSSMMTLMTGYGLARFLPRGNDWILRGREAMPVFAGIAALMSILVLASKILS